MFKKNKPKGHFEDDETIPQRNPEAFGYAAMPLVDLDLVGPREPENQRRSVGLTTWDFRRSFLVAAERSPPPRA